MNRLIPYLIHIAAIVCAALALSSCEDRFEYPGYEDIPEGTSTVNLSFSFPDYTPALDSRASGTALRNIRTLWLAIYQDGGDFDGKLLDKIEVTNFTPNATEPRPGTDESATGHAQFSLTYPNGRYRIYAIVNHDLSGADIDSEDKLFHLPLTWHDDATNGINHNDQMFGWFRSDENKPDFHGAPTSVVIRPGTGTLHAWVRRAASKITVAFNTNRLNENVFIYLKSVSIVDIPKQCYLHSDNNLGEDDYRLEKAFADAGASSTIYFQGASASDNGKNDHRKWPMIAAGDLVFGLHADEAGHKHNAVIDIPDEQKDNLNYYQAKVIERINELTKLEHSETTRALYFYENMQAPGTKGTPSDKRQIVGAAMDTPQTGIVPSYPNGNFNGSHNADGTLKDDAYDKLGWKDARPWGTYIEVRGYYENATGKGDIVYRFMLGKDEITNYEAERNHHYKLTLVFNGDANDVDFHIDYEEEAKPGLLTPTETYVPYLYNQESFTTVRATPKKGYDLFSLRAVIVDNEWRPHQAVKNTDYWGDAWDAQITHRTFDANRSYAVDRNVYPKDAPEAAENCEFGFLSLWKVAAVTRDAGNNTATKTVLVDNLRKFYYRHNAPGYGSVSLGARSYTKVPTMNGQTVDTPDASNGGYSISRSENPINGEIDYVATIPLFTRAKTLDPWAVYSGANPFYEHHRYARIKFIATYTKKDPTVSGPEEYEDESYTDVLQARRLDNPRGIYRSAKRLDAFHVNLKYKKLGTTAGEIFESVVSKGPWTAEIESDPSGIVEISANGQMATGAGGKITGRTNTQIDFTYRPRKTAEGTSYGAVIKVTYHNNTCVHKILVKQGYAAHTIGAGKTKFSAFNVYDSGNLVKNPLSRGSLFRAYSNLTFPIAEENDNVAGLRYGQIPSSSSTFIVHGKGNLTWASISTWNNPGNNDPFYTQTTAFRLKNEAEGGATGSYRLPTYEQCLELGLVRDGEAEDADNDINFAFGITYGDGATFTQSTSDAYSFTDYHNTGADSDKGSRGLIIYSKSRGDNIFLPFGATGHGRRRNKYSSNGLLRYGDLDAAMSGNTNIFRPMAWNLFEQYGAVYWTSDIGHSGSHTNSDGINDYHIAFDINYGNYMVSRGVSTQYCPSNGAKWDALLIRPVKD